MTKEEIQKEIEKVEQTQQGQTARDVLLRSATELFALNGLDGTSTRDIAKHSDLNISLISYYFGGKEGLYKEVLSQFAEKTSRKFNQLFSQVDEDHLNAEAFKKIMHIFVAEVVRSRFEDGQINKILEREMMDGLPHARDIFENTFTKIVEKIVRLYQLGQQRKFVRPDVHPHVLFFSLIHANDMFMNMNQCQTSMQQHMLKIPEQMSQYIQQMYIIFVEGVMI